MTETTYVDEPWGNVEGEPGFYPATLNSGPFDGHEISLLAAEKHRDENVTVVEWVEPVVWLSFGQFMVKYGLNDQCKFSFMGQLTTEEATREENLFKASEYPHRHQIIKNGDSDNG